MSVWNYIGEFFLFRWLFDSHKQNEAKRDASNSTISNADRNFADDLDSRIGFGRHSEYRLTESAKEWEKNI